MVNLVQSHLLDRSEAVVLRGLRESGLREGTDFTIREYWELTGRSVGEKGSIWRAEGRNAAP